MLRIINGLVVDPANGIQGEVRDVFIDGGRVLDPAEVPEGLNDMETIDASGCAVLPGGVEVHSHIAGAKVNSGRIMCPEDHYEHFRPKTDVTRSGCGVTVPTTFMTGYTYAQLGYTTVFEAAVPPLEARHAHEELLDVPIVDKGCYTVMGNNHMVMKVLSDPDRSRRRERLRELVSWLLKASRGYAVKIVNPGGVENWKWSQGAADLDTPVQPFGVTPRQIVTGLAATADELGLPHPIHLHCNHLGEPGNVETTLATMRALEGHRAHFTHLQFNGYAKTKKGGFASGAPRLAAYLDTHPDFTFDVGQLVFGPATTMTSDAPMEFKLHQLTHHKWMNCDIEMESGSGIVPMLYKPGMLANAVQWCTGLELMLMVKNPWQICLTTDHPNAGPFTAYPDIIRLLMDLDYRRSWLDKIHPRAKKTSNLAGIDRVYTLDEIAVITRGAQARVLGLERKGHLGPGADGDVAVFPILENKAEMFSSPRYVIKRGEVVIRNGEIVIDARGRTLCVNPEGGQGLAQDLSETFAGTYTVEMANYMVEAEYLHQPEVVPCG